MAPAIVKKSGRGEVSASYIKHLLHKRTAENARAAKAKPSTGKTRSRIAAAAGRDDDAGTSRRRRYKRRRKVRRRRTAATVSKRTPVTKAAAKPNKTGVTIATQTADFSSEEEEDQQPSTSAGPLPSGRKQTKRTNSPVENVEKKPQDSSRSENKREVYREALAAKKAKKPGLSSPEIITLSDEDVKPTVAEPSTPVSSAVPATAQEMPSRKPADLRRQAQSSAGAVKKTRSSKNARNESSGNDEGPSTSASRISRKKTANSVAPLKKKPLMKQTGARASSSEDERSAKIKPKKPRGDFMSYYDSAEDSDYVDADFEPAPKTRRQIIQEEQMQVSSDPRYPLERHAVMKTQKEPRTKTCVPIDGLFQIAPVARALAKALPMKTLNSLAQASRDFRDVVNYEKSLPRRQTLDFVHRRNIIMSLDEGRAIAGSVILDKLSDVFCDPEYVITFSTPNIMYTYRLHIDDARMGEERGIGTDLRSAIVGLLPKSVNQVFHIRTHAVMPPLPVAYHLRGRTRDYQGIQESSRDLVMLCIPRIDGVNIWSEHISDQDMRTMLKSSGWLEARTEKHFLLPLIKEIEVMAPKFVMMFTRRMPEYTNVVSPEFPVLLFNTLDNLESDRHPVFRDPGSDYGVQWLAFGGRAAVAHQVVLKITDERAERNEAIQQLRDCFEVQQVMGGRMVMFYFRNVSKFEQRSAHFEAIYTDDVTEIRELFPRVAIFGGSYLNAMGTVFTKNKNAPDFGKFFSGRHTTFLTALVLGD